MDWSVEQLYQELLALDEHPRIEAKRATEIGKSVMQTVCAFANEPGLGGGFLLLGVCAPDDTHPQYRAEGVANPDQLLNQLQNNCRNQFEQPISITSQHAQIDDRLVVGVFVPELEPAAKPCRFTGKPDKYNKRKTGVWRRGLNGDYECTERELEPILLAKSGVSYEQTMLPNAEWDDLDSGTIEQYRMLRAKVKPHAEELQVSDEEMLRALNLVRKIDGAYKPNLAGLLLFAKPLSLRRLLPAVRADYVRINGTEWVEDPEQRFVTTLDLREPLIRLIPRLEAAILDDMPRHFRLEEGNSQRSDQPLLPQKVIREAVVNALMHRDYQVNQPVLVVRYSNRLEIRNPGYSLKPEHELGEMGSVLRNPNIASVLYDLDFAETKGSGIATIRRLLHRAGLTMPVFVSNRNSNQFTATYLLHQLMDAGHLNWLQQFVSLKLSGDEAKALILAKETGAVDNAAVRAVTGLDTLSASQMLGRLCKVHGLLEKGGGGPSTYYRLTSSYTGPNEGDLFSEHSYNLAEAGSPYTNTGDLAANRGDLAANGGDLAANGGDLAANGGNLPPNLLTTIAQLTPKAKKEILWPVILRLCDIKPHSADELAQILRRKVKRLKDNHLSAMREQNLIDYLHPHVINHPQQAYIITKQGKHWLATKDSSS